MSGQNLGSPSTLRRFRSLDDVLYPSGAHIDRHTRRTLSYDLRSLEPDPSWHTRTVLASDLPNTDLPLIPPWSLQTPLEAGPGTQATQATTHSQTPPPHRNRPLHVRIISWFGYGRDASRARRSLVGLLWNLMWGFSQLVTIVTILVLSSTVLKSPTEPEKTEWEACERPLGTWACIWVFRVILASGLTYRSYLRDRKAHTPDAESQNATPELPVPGSAVAVAVPASGTTAQNSTRPRNREAPPLPSSQFFNLLTVFSSVITLVWFLVAHILEYTSINTCRHSSPHIWWLIFGILSIMYVMVLEVALLGLVVFIVAPILLLIWNIFLICIGRHPLQNPTMIRPEVGKLSKAFVHRIPLVMYIPPPPDGDKTLPLPQPAHLYPPQPISPPPPKRRFRFLRRKSEHEGSPTTDEKEAEGSSEPKTWESNWEKSKYPFVVLEGNRAVCAICLVDFEAPTRMNADLSLQASGDSDTEAHVHSSTDQRSEIIVVEDVAEEGRGADGLKLEDAGEGAQPLRLLGCGHVFHQTCLDPWLIDVSGRCPVCQRPVELPTEPPKRKRRQTARS